MRPIQNNRIGGFIIHLSVVNILIEFVSCKIILGTVNVIDLSVK